MMGASRPTKPDNKSPKSHPDKRKPAWTTAKTVANTVIRFQESSLIVTLEQAETAKQSAHSDKANRRADSIATIFYGLKG